MGKLYIGTSGWQYKGWKGNFYPEDIPQKDWLRYYSKQFNTVEVNSSFYRQTKASTFKKWKAEVGPDFTFAIKAVRFITAFKKTPDFQSGDELNADMSSSFRGNHAIYSRLAASSFAYSGEDVITHVKRLKDTEESVKIFFDNAGALVSKSKRKSKQVILWQLPANFKKDVQRLKNF